MNKKFLLMAAAMAMSEGMDIRPIRQEKKEQAEASKEWRRKKCKSCKFFACKAYLKPTSQACPKYEHK